MEAHLSQTQLNRIFEVQELCDKLRRRAKYEDCHTYIRGNEVDREKFYDYLDCISAAIDNMAENLL